MAARMQPQPSRQQGPGRHSVNRRWDLADDSHEELALIVPFPATEWDRLDRWARKEAAEQDRELAARNAALARI